MSNNNNKSNNDPYVPFVSIFTPTFNRRPFLANMIEMVKNQDYPKEKMEWIIVDDGTDNVQDVFASISFIKVKYYRSETKLPLGKKRNIGNKFCTGDIIVYMDDDDYYPPTRVGHAVTTLQLNPTILCVGSSELFLFFTNLNRMFKFGPYGPNHATAATFAFRKELLLQTQFNDEASLAEEKAFLKNYTVPIVQLDPFKTILVFSHIHNTFDKNILLNDYPSSPFITDVNYPVDAFIKEETVYKFFMEELSSLLKNYEPGLGKFKPDVIEQFETIQTERNKIKAEQQNYLDILKKLNIDPNASITKQNNQTVIHAEKKLQEQSMVIHDLLSENKKLKDALVVMERRLLESSVDLNLLQDKVEYFERKIRELKMIEQQQQQQQHPSV